MDEPAFIDAVRKGDEVEVVTALRGDRGLARVRDASGVSVVCLAVYLGREKLTRLLCAQRDDLDVFEASTAGEVERVRALLDAEPGLANAYSPDGFQPLGYACFFGRLELLELLLARGAQLEAPARNPMQVRPLHSAVAHTDEALALRMARRLLESGASPDVLQQGGFTPMHEAALRGHAPLVHLLLEYGADPLALNADGKRPSDCARDGGHFEVAWLISPR
jgi:ankyrin repeat protein